MFGLLFGAKDADNFKLSLNVRVGLGIIILKPRLEGEWMGMKLVSTPEPCVIDVANWQHYIPESLPETVSFEEE